MKNQSPRVDGEADSPSRDEVLKRMLKMKPKPHIAKGGQKPAKKKQNVRLRAGAD